MNLEREKILDKARKLKELADRGEGGEKENAINFLKIYMEKHKISEKELYAHKIKDENQFKGFGTDAMIKNMVAELQAKGLMIQAKTLESLHYNNRIINNLKLKINARPALQWFHDERNFSYKGMYNDVVYFDIQQTKDGATLYRSNGISANMKFLSVDAAIFFCNGLFNSNTHQ